jgi:hypothetical protein
MRTDRLTEGLVRVLHRDANLPKINEIIEGFNEGLWEKWMCPLHYRNRVSACMTFVPKSGGCTVHWHNQCSWCVQTRKAHRGKYIQQMIFQATKYFSLYMLIKLRCQLRFFLTWPSLLASAFCCSPSHTFSRISLVSVCFGSDSFHPLVVRILCLNAKIMRMFSDLESVTDVSVWPLIFYRKGEAIPLQAWTGPEGSRRFRLPDF